MLYTISPIETLSAAAIGITLALGFGVGGHVPVEAAHHPAVQSLEQGEDQKPVKPRIPVEVIRVIDGDTVEVRAQIWLDQHITTKVRIRSIDAPELQSRCTEERLLARAARDHLIALIGNGRGYLTDLGHDKFGSRVLANIMTIEGRDIAGLMLALGHARPYRGSRRQSWC
jgi:micrococcal nuclease